MARKSRLRKKKAARSSNSRYLLWGLVILLPVVWAIWQYCSQLMAVDNEPEVKLPLAEPVLLDGDILAAQQECRSFDFFSGVLEVRGLVLSYNSTVQEYRDQAAKCIQKIFAVYAEELPALAMSTSPELGFPSRGNYNANEFPMSKLCDKHNKQRKSCIAFGSLELSTFVVRFKITMHMAFAYQYLYEGIAPLGDDVLAIRNWLDVGFLVDYKLGAAKSYSSLKKLDVQVDLIQQCRDKLLILTEGKFGKLAEAFAILAAELPYKDDLGFKSWDQPMYLPLMLQRHSEVKVERHEHWVRQMTGQSQRYVLDGESSHMQHLFNQYRDNFTDAQILHVPHKMQ